jgi:hypothetical protein
MSDKWTDEVTDDMHAAWQEWLDERPPHVRVVAEKFNPWDMYRLTTTGQRVRILGFHETEGDDVGVYIYAEHESLGPISGRNVFGIDPTTLVAWDGESRDKWIVEELPGGKDLGGGFVTGPGVSYRLAGDQS